MLYIQNETRYFLHKEGRKKNCAAHTYHLTFDPIHKFFDLDIQTYNVLSLILLLSEKLVQAPAENVDEDFDFLVLMLSPCPALLLYIHFHHPNLIFCRISSNLSIDS